MCLFKSNYIPDHWFILCGLCPATSSPDRCHDGGLWQQQGSISIPVCYWKSGPHSHKFIEQKKKDSVKVMFFRRSSCLSTISLGEGDVTAPPAGGHSYCSSWRIISQWSLVVWGMSAEAAAVGVRCWKEFCKNLLHCDYLFFFCFLLNYFWYGCPILQT